MDEKHQSSISLSPLKLHYFLHGFGGSPILPYFGVIMKQHGLPGSSMAFIFSCTTILLQIMTPLLGTLMDKYSKHKMGIFRLLLLGAIFSLSLLRFAPPIEMGTKDIGVVCSVNKDDQLMTLRVKDVDPCLEEKLSSFSPFIHECQFQCGSHDKPQIRFQAKFDGRLVSFKDHYLRIPLMESPPCSSSANLSCYANCPDSELRQALNRNRGGGGAAMGTLAFWTIFILFLCGGLCNGAVTTFQDAICHQSLKGRRETFGQQRVYASIGWGCAAVIVGYFVDKASQRTWIYDYTLAYDAFLLAWLIDLYIVGKINLPTSAQITSKEGIGSSLSGLIFKRDIVAFLFYCTSVGICASALSYHFILLEELGDLSVDCEGAKALKFLQGLALAFNTIGETPMFIYSGQFLSKFGIKTVMSSVLALYAFRFCFYCLMTTPRQTLWIEIINGGCCALFFPAMTTFANKIAPEGTATTMLALAYTFYNGVGTSIGNFMAGSLYDAYGAQQTFGYFSIFAIMALTLFVMSSRRSF